MRSRCGSACQFIHPRYAELERQVHGRERDAAAPTSCTSARTSRCTARACAPRAPVPSGPG
jgi:hypothetical protein